MMLLLLLFVCLDFFFFIDCNPALRDNYERGLNIAEEGFFFSH